MARVLLAYGTTEGHTAKIAEHMAETLRGLGHEAEVRPVDKVADAELADYQAIAVGGSLHQGRHQRDVRAFVARHAALLDALPSAFFSVSLAAASRDVAEQEAAMRLAKTFVETAGWRPNAVASFPGALMYTRYGWFKRRLMRRIAAKEGGDTDTSRDHDYTDWDEVTRFAEAFSGEIASSITVKAAPGSAGSAPAAASKEADR